MTKCLCFKCDFSVIREWKKISYGNGLILFTLQIHCNWTNTDIVDDEQFDKKLFLTERLFEMTCNRFKESKKKSLDKNYIV